MPVIDLTAGCVLVLEAVDPTDGATVAGVTISDGVAWVDNQGGPLDNFPDAQPHYIAVALGAGD